MDIKNIIDFHIHLYYDQDSLEMAKKVGKKAVELFGLSIGQFHERNVGPHPRWSVQLTVDKEKYAEVLAWFAQNREELIIFSHPNTGSDLEDHQEKAIWMGECLKDEMDYSIFH